MKKKTAVDAQIGMESSEGAETPETKMRKTAPKKEAAPKKAAPAKKAVDKVGKPSRMLTGEVVSDKMDKTIVVRIERSYMHPRLKKVMRTSKKYKVHDDSESASIGDIVEIYEGRPLSKTKYMYLARIVRAHS